MIGKLIDRLRAKRFTVSYYDEGQPIPTNVIVHISNAGGAAMTIRDGVYTVHIECTPAEERLHPDYVEGQERRLFYTYYTTTDSNDAWSVYNSLERGFLERIF